MGELDKSKGDSRQFIHGIPDNPDPKFWAEVYAFRGKLQPQQKAIFDKELDQALEERAHRPSDAGKATHSQQEKPIAMQQSPEQKQYQNLATEQSRQYNLIVEDLLKKGVIHAPADVNNPNHPAFQQIQDLIKARMMELQLRMDPYTQQRIKKMQEDKKK